MDLSTFLERRKIQSSKEPQYRELCLSCWQPGFSCYCVHIERFYPGIKFAILIHPIEDRRRIATGRMAHLCMENSELIVGEDYSDNAHVNRLLADTAFQPLVLYPGHNSINLSEMTPRERTQVLDPNKTPLIFVIDGTWNTAQKTMYRSRNIKDLPRLSFVPPSQSQFRVRQQPRPECYSTIEAIHHLIELLGSRPGYDASLNAHHSLIRTFTKMIDRQVELAQSRPGKYRRRAL